MKVWMLAAESVLMAVLWVACLLLDIFASFQMFFNMEYIIDGILMMIFLMLLHVIINCWLVRIVTKTFTKLGILLFVTLQIPLFMLFRGAWFGLRSCCVQGQRHKTRRALRAKFSLCYEMKSSSEKLPVEELEHCEASCISSQNGEISGYVRTVPVTGEAAEVTSDAEQGAETPVQITTTKFVKDTNKIQLNLDNSAEIYAGEPSVYKYTIRCLQALFAEKKRLSYHFVTDSTCTKILHVSCTDRRIGSLPDHIINENPRVICNDTHYILNLSRVNGYEVYDITKRSSGEVTSFVQRDLTKLIWIPIWPLAVIKMFDLTWKFIRRGHGSVSMVWGSIVVGLLTWMVTQRALYHSITDRLLIAGLRVSFYLVRTLLICGIGVLFNLLHIPYCYLSAKAAGAIFFVVYIAFIKATRNVELFQGAFDKYTFYSMHDSVVQVGESLTYCAWAISLYCTVPDKPFTFYIMLTTIFGQSIGLVWIWFVRPRLRKPLEDPTRVLDMIKQMEYARL